MKTIALLAALTTVDLLPLEAMPKAIVPPIVTLHPICEHPQHLRRIIWLARAGIWIQQEYAKMDADERESWWRFAELHYGCRF